MTDEPETPEPDEKSDLPPEQEERIVEKVVSKVKDTLRDIFPAAKSGDPEPDEEPAEVPEEKEPTTVKEIENDMEAQVRAAVEKIGAEEQHKQEHEKLKKEVERAPVQVGKVTRFLWGGGEK
jgi:hypothetical protein